MDMKEPSLPIDETQRLLSLHSLRLLDTPDEERFDRITRMARRMFGVDICLVSLVDANRQWFKSKTGLDACETGRDISFCGHAILSDDIFIVEDTLEDERFADNPLVTGAPHIRFYAGFPIKSPDGRRIGTLCLIHPEPHKLTADEELTLKDLGRMVEDEIRITSEAVIDELTKVANRRGFHMFANQTLAVCRRTGTPAELAFFDLDGFKEINDTYGHAAGDDLLVYFAELLVKCFRNADAIGRLGGDEFVALLVGSDGESDVALNRLLVLGADSDCEIRRKLAWSVGVIRFDPERHTTVESLLVDADSNMYDNKVSKRAANG
jgi:diguanylate cyclase (GGDEF)-like protein